jgi:hypothetical protein
MLFSKNIPRQADEDLREKAEVSRFEFVGRKLSATD